jgi:hypothetical protein
MIDMDDIDLKTLDKDIARDIVQSLREASHLIRLCDINSSRNGVHSKDTAKKLSEHRKQVKEIATWYIKKFHLKTEE